MDGETARRTARGVNGTVDGVEQLNRWSPQIRLAAAGLAVVYVALRRDELPAGHESFLWAICVVFASAAVALLVGIRRTDEVRRARLDVAALALDVLAVFGFIFLFSYDPGQPLRSLVFLLVVEAGLRFGLRGGIGVAVASLPLLLVVEVWRVLRFDYDFQPESIVVRMGLVLLVGTVVGQLVSELVGERRRAVTRAEEAERFRDALGRRVDLLEASNRCARALGSSLELEQASQAFSRELRGLVPFDRMAIVLAEDEQLRVITDTEPSGGFPRSLLASALEGRLAVHEDLAGAADPDERALVEVGLRCLLAAPLLAGARAVGVLVLARSQPRSFSTEETELVSLLGRLVATAVQNMRAYEAERETAEELRRLSALRADFVSLVSHELRSPLAAAIGSAITLRERWQQLTPPQRESFLSLIVDETRRCAMLVGDVLDTSRIEGGTFSYHFTDLDVAPLVEDAVASARVGQDRVRVTASVPGALPVRGDRERLRQVLTNLIDNAVKYSPLTEAVEVSGLRRDGCVLVEVSDRGPGVAPEAQALIFEKFGRGTAGASGKPGTGLGLFIARSIAEAHGGSLDVRSAPPAGATFTLTLPAGEDKGRSGH